MRPQAVVLDLDGVIWSGRKMLPGAVAAVGALRAQGARVFFATNNSAESSETIRDRLESAGVGCAIGSLATAADEAVGKVAELPAAAQGVFVVGTPHLRARVAQSGLRPTGRAQCGVLLVGNDPEFDWCKLAYAADAARRGIPFVACNRDGSYPHYRRRLPGCGAIVAAIEAASGRRATCVAGKPEPDMMQRLLVEHGESPCDCIVVGDEAADIAMARRAGASAILIAPPGTRPVRGARRFDSLAAFARAFPEGA